MSILISLACVAADTYVPLKPPEFLLHFLTPLDSYTAITLLVYNRWFSEIEPAIPPETAKVIFSVCILISYVLIIADWFPAQRAIRRGGVADAYMDAVALRWSCVWGGKGKEDTGWRRFLVFARLTEKRGKMDYVALFTYFSFKGSCVFVRPTMRGTKMLINHLLGWVRIVFAEGPRVVINAFTLASVVKANLVSKGQLEPLSNFSNFFKNIQLLYSQNKAQVFTLGSMTFTTVLWLFAMLQLLLACFLFILFLWRLIGDDSLQKYCKDRIDRRVSEIVNDNHKQGLEKDMKKGGTPRAPTIPVPAAVALEKPSYGKPTYTVSAAQRLPTTPYLPEIGRGRTPKPLSRAPTSSTVASSARPSVGRSQTMKSNDSYGSSSGLVSGQAAMGHDGRGPQQQWGPPPVPYVQDSSARGDGRRTPVQSSSGRSDGVRTPAPIEGPSYQMQNLQSLPSQNGRPPFATDRLGRQQKQSEYDNMPLREQNQSWEQNQGQYGARPGPGPPTRSGSGKSNYGPGQGRFPIAVKTGGQNQQERLPIAVRPQDPQQQQYYPGESPGQLVQYYNNEDSPQQMESPDDYYSQQGQEQWGYYPPQQQQQQLPQMPQPVAYEYSLPSEQQQPQFYQQPEIDHYELPRLQTQNIAPSSGGYKRPVYTPASAVAPAHNFDFNLPVNYFLGQGDSAQTRSATVPPTRQQRAPLQVPARSATARPDVERGESGVMRPIQRSATYGTRGEMEGRRL